MTPTLRTRAVTAAATLLFAVAVALVGALTIAYAGVLDVGAMTKSPGYVAWFLATTRDHSVAARADSVRPPSLDDPAMIAEGAKHYREMCVGCHAAPGVERSEISQGLEPAPPSLAEANMSSKGTAEAFWIVKNGIKMTGMPAFGKTHDDQKIWDIVAFVRQLARMTPEQYRQRVTSAK